MTGASGGADGTDVIERLVTVSLEGGLHARPASRLVEVARGHDCDLELGRARSDERVRADSILAITSLGIGPDVRVRVIASGADAEPAVEAATAALEGGEVDE